MLNRWKTLTMAAGLPKTCEIAGEFPAPRYGNNEAHNEAQKPYTAHATPARWVRNAEELRRLAAGESALASKDKPPRKG
jgi:hypothetical protein